MSTKPLLTALTLLSSLAAGSAHALPLFGQCTAYKTFGSGTLKSQVIASENSPNPVGEPAARLSAAHRCRELWRARGGTDLSYANAGIKVEVWETGEGYNYACMQCDNSLVSVGTSPILAGDALQLAHEAIPGGQVVNVTRKFFTEGASILPYFEVDVAVEGGHLAQVYVDGTSGAVTLPEVLSSQDVFPVNVCQ